MVTIRSLLSDIVLCLHGMKPDTSIINENGAKRFNCCKTVITYRWEKEIDPSLYDLHDKFCPYRRWIDMKKKVDEIVSILGIK